MVTRKAKDYKTTLNLESVNKIISFATDNNYTLDYYEGSLLDNYIIYNTENVHIGKIKPRKYIILHEKYLNEWSSTTEMIMTNDENLVKEYINMYRN